MAASHARTYNTTKKEILRPVSDMMKTRISIFYRKLQRKRGTLPARPNFLGLEVGKYGRHRAGSTENKDRGTQEGCFSVTGNTLLEENIGQCRRMFSSHVSQLGQLKEKTVADTRCIVLKRIISRSSQRGY